MACGVNSKRFVASFVIQLIKRLILKRAYFWGAYQLSNGVLEQSVSPIVVTVSP